VVPPAAPPPNSSMSFVDSAAALFVPAPQQQQPVPVQPFLGDGVVSTPMQSAEVAQVLPRPRPRLRSRASVGNVPWIPMLRKIVKCCTIVLCAIMRHTRLIGVPLFVCLNLRQWLRRKVLRSRFFWSYRILYTSLT
jgi:hypothetical protein